LKSQFPLCTKQRISSTKSGVSGVSQEIQGNLDYLVEAIETGQAIAVSNGSFQEQQGLASWTIKGKNKHNQILEKGQTLGSPGNQHAYWSELFRLWGILCMLHRFTNDHHITKGHMHSMQQIICAKTSTITSTSRSGSNTLQFDRCHQIFQTNVTNRDFFQAHSGISRHRDDNGTTPNGLDEHQNGHTCKSNDQ